MKMVSERTVHVKFLRNLFTIFHLIFAYGPLIFYTAAAFANAEATSGEKITLTLILLTSFVLLLISTMLNVRNKQGLHKTCFWLIIIGILTCLTRVKELIFWVAFASIIDELVLCKLMVRYGELYRTNKEIDRRYE